MPRHALLTPETTAWINSFGLPGLSATQRMALAQMRDGRAVTNQSMRNLGLDGRRATYELAELVTRGLAVRIGERRHARYVLVPLPADPPSPQNPSEHRQPAANRETAILEALSQGVDMSRRDLENATGINQVSLLRVLDALIAVGKVEATAPPKSPLRRYRRPPL